MAALKFLLLGLLSPCIAWNLASLKFPEDVILKDIAIHKSRAFIVAPRLSRAQAVTLFEAPWPELSNMTGYATPRLFKPFPKLESQIPGDCELLQSGVSLAIDSKSKHLYVLDTGSKKCSAKVIQYDVWFSTFVKQKRLSSIDNRHLNSLILDSGTGTGSETIYISDAGDCSLLVMKTSDLEFTRIFPRYNEYIVPVLTLAVCSGHLFMTSYDSDLMFAVSLRDVQKSLTSNLTTSPLQTHFLGYKLGISSGLYCDEPDGLLYYLIRDYAIVRWDITKPLIAENHQVLVQSEKVLPYVSEFFKERSSEHVFVLNSIYNKYHKYTVKIQNKNHFYSYILT